MKRNGCVRLALVIAVAMSTWTAAAQTDREAVGPSREVVQERLYVFDGRFDLSLMGGVAMNPKLINHTAFLFRPAYHITDAWSLELTGGYVLAQERQNLTNRNEDSIRVSMAADPTLDNEFADMGQMEWVAHGGIRWSPIYGKLNLAAEIPVHFGAYASVAGGVAGVRRVSLADCSSVTPGDDGFVRYDCHTTEDVKPSLGMAVGLRFYIANWFAVRTELSNFMFPDEYRLNFRNPAEMEEVTGITSLLMFLGGVSFYF